MSDQIEKKVDNSESQPTISNTEKAVDQHAHKRTHEEADLTNPEIREPKEHLLKKAKSEQHVEAKEPSENKEESSKSEGSKIDSTNATLETEPQITKDTTSNEDETALKPSDEKDQDNSKDNEQDKTDNKENDKKEDKDQKPGFVFGQGSKFGATAFSGLSGRKNVFGSSAFSQPSQPSESSTPAPQSSSSSVASTPAAESKPFVFGVGSKFSNAFQKATNRQSIFDKLDTKKETADSENKESEKGDSNGEPAKSGNLYQAVKLEKKEITTGEEEETAIFQCKAKLYVLNLHDIKSGWKERGVGVLHINDLPKEKSQTAKARIVMRTIGILKVILNASISKGFEVFKGMESSLHSEKFIRLNNIETDYSNPEVEKGEHGLAKNQKLVQYAIRVGNSETANELYNTIKDLIPTSSSEDSKESSDRESSKD